MVNYEMKLEAVKLAYNGEEKDGMIKEKGLQRPWLHTSASKWRPFVTIDHQNREKK